MNSLKLKLLSAHIELIWWHIRKERRQGQKLLEQGVPYSSRKLLKLNHRFSKHCAMAMKAQRNYEHVSGLNPATAKMRA